MNDWAEYRGITTELPERFGNPSHSTILRCLQKIPISPPSNDGAKRPVSLRTAFCSLRLTEVGSHWDFTQQGTLRLRNWIFLTRREISRCLLCNQASCPANSYSWVNVLILNAAHDLPGREKQQAREFGTLCASCKRRRTGRCAGFGSRKFACEE